MCCPLKRPSERITNQDRNEKTECPQKHHLESVMREEHVLVSHFGVCFTPLDLVAAGVTCCAFCRDVAAFSSAEERQLGLFLGMVSL